MSTGYLLGSGSVDCRSGCLGNIGLLWYQCTDFSIVENWSAGQGSNEADLSETENFEAS